MGGRNSKTKKTQSGLGQNGTGDADGGGNKDRCDRVGNHVPKDDSQISDAQGSGSSDKVLFPQGEKFSTDKASSPFPAGEADDDHDVVDAWRKKSDHSEYQEETGEAEHDVHKSHDQGVYGKSPCEKKPDPWVPMDCCIL